MGRALYCNVLLNQSVRKPKIGGFLLERPIQSFTVSKQNFVRIMPHMADFARLIWQLRVFIPWVGHSGSWTTRLGPYQAIYAIWSSRRS